MPKTDTIPRRLFGWPGRVWGSSLPLRLITTTLIASWAILILGGWMILIQASHGILQGKQDSVVAEAGAALNRMQLSLTDANLAATSLTERLTQLVDQARATSEQYKIIIETPSGFIVTGVVADTVPQTLRDAVRNTEGLWVTPTEVIYPDGADPVPGFVVGGNLYAPDGESYPAYFIFELTQEQGTVRVLQGAVLSAMMLLSVAMGGIAYVVSRQVGKPVRQASNVAQRIAAGDLDQRMPVVGTDDLASLASSMNDMASTLSNQITQLEELSRLQRRFVSDVSHELRTPLTTVRMASDLLFDMRAGVPPTLMRTVELMHTEVDRFEALLADLLEISRFDAGAATLSPEEADFAAVIADSVDDVQPLAARSGVTLTLEAPTRLMASIDTRRVRRIMRNLLFNAIEHSESRPVEVRVAGDDHAVAVSVRDHGAGFLPEQSELVFHRFWRADPSRTRSLGGTGLGLAIALEDAHLHNGWLQAWGSPGEGANFRLTLPRRADSTLDQSPLPLELNDGQVNDDESA